MKSVGANLCVLLFLFLFGMLFSGCTLSPKDVKLHTREEMEKILNDRYGDAEFVSVEKLEETNQLVYTFKDTKYGFTYKATSHPRGVGMDGSNFYYDGASIYYEYMEPFLSYFMEQEKDVFAAKGIELRENVDPHSTGEWPLGKRFSLKDKVLFTTEEDFQKDLDFVLERVQSYKKVPEIMLTYEFKVYGCENDNITYLGSWTEEKGFETAEKQRIDYYMYQARDLGKIEGEVTYLRTEQKTVSELGLEDQEFYKKEVKTYDKKVNVYYFEVAGQEYYIIDQWVAQERDPEDGGGGIFQYYQNYKYYEVSKYD